MRGSMREPSVSVRSGAGRVPLPFFPSFPALVYCFLLMNRIVSIFCSLFILLFVYVCVGAACFGRCFGGVNQWCTFLRIRISCREMRRTKNVQAKHKMRHV